MTVCRIRAAERPRGIGGVRQKGLGESIKVHRRPNRSANAHSVPGHRTDRPVETLTVRSWQPPRAPSLCRKSALLPKPLLLKAGTRLALQRGLRVHPRLSALAQCLVQ